MLYQRLPYTTTLRRVCAMVAILAVSVAGMAFARGVERAVRTHDGVHMAVEHVEVADHTVTLGLRVENRSGRAITLHHPDSGGGLALSDDRGGRYLFLPPAENRTLTVEPNQALSGELVFFGPVRQDIGALTLTTRALAASGEPLELAMHPAAAEGPGVVVPSAGSDGPRAFRLDGRTSVPAGVELLVERIELVPAGYQIDVVVENRSGRSIALNQDNGLSLRDNAGHLYQFQPPAGNRAVMIPPNGSLQGTFLFHGQPSPLAEHVVLTSAPIQGQAFEIAMPVPVTARRLAFSDDETVAMMLDHIQFEGDLITVDASVVNTRQEPVLFNRALGLRMHDNHGNVYPVIAPPGNAVTEIPAGSMGSAQYVFAGPIASDAGALTLSTNAVGNGRQSGPNLQFELPVLAAAPGPELPQSTLSLSRLPASTVHLQPLGQVSTARVQQLRSGLGAYDTEQGTFIELQSDVLFDVDSATLRPDARPVLDQLAELTQLMAVSEVIVEGHTDSTGDANYNLELSRRRANSVSDYLRERGVLHNANVLVRGFGEAQPVASNDTGEGRQRNRRVEIVLQEDRPG